MGRAGGILVAAMALTACLDAPPSDQSGGAGDGNRSDAAAEQNDGGATDAGECPEPTSAPGGPCIQPCDSCVGNVCEVDCNDGQCESPIECPAGFDCQVSCGQDDCIDVVVNCPDDYGCTVTCAGDDACQRMNLMCANGPCEIRCVEHTKSCYETAVVCGSGSCTATCMGADPPAMDCTDACACTSDC